MVSFPNTSNNWAIFFKELSLSVYHIMTKVTYIFLSIDEKKSSFSFLNIFIKCTNEFYPVAIEIAKVRIVKRGITVTSTIVEQCTLSLEIVVLPIPIINYPCFIGKVEFAFSTHLAFGPLAFVDFTIRECEWSFSMTKTIHKLAFKNTFVLISFLFIPIIGVCPCVTYWLWLLNFDIIVSLDVLL